VPDPLSHLGRSDDVLGGSSYGAPAAEPEDALDLWGRRVGRGLAIVVAIGIVVFFLSNGGLP
jgi:hypothetical protein